MTYGFLWFLGAGDGWRPQDFWGRQPGARSHAQRALIPLLSSAIRLRLLPTSAAPWDRILGFAPTAYYTKMSSPWSRTPYRRVQIVEAGNQALVFDWLNPGKPETTEIQWFRVRNQWFISSLGVPEVHATGWTLEARRSSREDAREAQDSC